MKTIADIESDLVGLYCETYKQVVIKGREHEKYPRDEEIQRAYWACVSHCELYESLLERWFAYTSSRLSDVALVSLNREGL